MKCSPNYLHIQISLAALMSVLLVQPAGTASSQWSYNLAPRKALPPGLHYVPKSFPHKLCGEEGCHTALDGQPGLGEGHGSMWRMKSSM